ncbi:hypothetical protein AeRB84_016674 [Aphanomyces euteiches]|nr:hypothetical protein AeRB84_016674 [Aphanomyces euteiches]
MSASGAQKTSKTRHYKCPLMANRSRWPNLDPCDARITFKMQDNGLYGFAEEVMLHSHPLPLVGQTARVQQQSQETQQGVKRLLYRFEAFEAEQQKRFEDLHLLVNLQIQGLQSNVADVETKIAAVSDRLEAFGDSIARLEHLLEASVRQNENKPKCTASRDSHALRGSDRTKKEEVAHARLELRQRRSVRDIRDEARHAGHEGARHGDMRGQSHSSKYSRLRAKEDEQRDRKRRRGERDEYYRRNETAMTTEDISHAPVYEAIDKNDYLFKHRMIDITDLDFCTCTDRCGNDCMNRITYMECYQAWNRKLGRSCGNRSLQTLEAPETLVFQTVNRGHGLKSVVLIPKGSTIVEYIGEVINQAMKIDRLAEQAKANEANCYMVELAEGVFIDSRRKGNKSRFINHSCMPNCEMVKVDVGPVSRLAIVAKEDIVVDTTPNCGCSEEDHSIQTLPRLLEKCVFPGTQVYSDKFLYFFQRVPHFGEQLPFVAYGLGYARQWVNHSEVFVDPLTKLY